MKKLKKLLLLTLVLCMLAGFAACRTDDTGEPQTEETTENSQTEDTDVNPPEETTENEPEHDENSLEGMLDRIYQTADLSAQFGEFIATGLLVTPITSENAGYHLGKEDIPFESAIASEPMMSTSAYSLCLVRVGEDTDIETVKNDIRENVDPRKWICVGVDPENVIVDSIGDVIILIMSDNEGEALHQAFLAL